MPYSERLNEIRKERKLSIADVSKLADISLSTVTRIFNGSGYSTSFDNYVRIATVLGVSLDEIAGLKRPEAPTVDDHVQTAMTNYAELLAEKDERINELKNERDKERKEKYKVFIALFSIVIATSVALAVDILNGHFGYFRY